MRKHPFDVFSAFAGVIMVAFGAAFLLTDFRGFVISLPDLRWVLPVGIMAIGLLGVVGVWRSHRR